MTKKHYVVCAKYIFECEFQHADSEQIPLSFPKIPDKTYPQAGDPDWRYRSQEFEVLVRTFTLSCPLLHIDPEAAIGGIKPQECYGLHLYNALIPGHQNLFDS